MNRLHWVVAVALGTGFIGCGSGSDSPTALPPVPSTTIAAQPSPSPSPAPSPSPTPGAQACTFELGPVFRLAISPREQRTNGIHQLPIKVRALPDWDEVWCLDRDKSHILDFNANQRNEANRECCYDGQAEWTISDPAEIVVTSSSRHPDGMIYRLNVEPRGRSTSFTIEAELDGVKSHPWQPRSGYRREPLRMVTMSEAQINRECKCIYLGNGLYEGTDCAK